MEKYESWKPDELGRVETYVPRGVQQAGARHLIVAGWSKLCNDEAEIAFEGGLVEFGASEVVVRKPEKGLNMMSIGVWAKDGWKGSVQIRMQDVRSGPIPIRILPSGQEVIQSTLQPLALAGSVLTLGLLAVGVDTVNAALLGGGIGSVVALRVLGRCYLSYRR